jgi:hypothetical protein
VPRIVEMPHFTHSMSFLFLIVVIYFLIPYDVIYVIFHIGITTFDYFQHSNFDEHDDFANIEANTRKDCEKLQSRY